MNIPVVPETATTREEALTNLQPKRDPAFPNGFAYYFSFAGLTQRTTERKRKFSSNATIDAAEDGTNDARSLMNQDFSEMRGDMAGSTLATPCAASLSVEGVSGRSGRILPERTVSVDQCR